MAWGEERIQNFRFALRVSLVYCLHMSLYLFFHQAFGAVWLYTLMPLAGVMWADTAVTKATGALGSTWHNNHEEYVMSSSVSNNIGWSYCRDEPAAHGNISQEQNGTGFAWLDIIVPYSGMEVGGEFLAHREGSLWPWKAQHGVLLVCSLIIKFISILRGGADGIQRAQHRAKQFTRKSGSSGVEDIKKVSLQHLEDGRAWWNSVGAAISLQLPEI